MMVIHVKVHTRYIAVFILFIKHLTTDEIFSTTYNSLTNERATQSVTWRDRPITARHSVVNKGLEYDVPNVLFL